jgi:hypothetical protein
MANDDEKPPEPVGGEVVSIEDARNKKAEEKAAGGEATPAPPAGPDVLGNALQPIMAAIARELAGLAGPDGNIKINSLSDDEQAKAKTQALLRGLGQGLGDVLAQALGKWADKVDLKFSVADSNPKGDAPKIEHTPIRSTPADEPPPGDDDPSKKS